MFAVHRSGFSFHDQCLNAREQYIFVTTLRLLNDRKATGYAGYKRAHLLYALIQYFNRLCQ